MKKRKLIFICLFFMLLILTSIFTFLLPDKSFSENENRVLAHKPTLSAETISTGTFQSGLSDYLSDQIPFREFLFQTNTTLQKYAGQKEINDVYIGADHYYFQKFTDDSYSTSRMYALFEMVSEFIENQQIPASFLLVPTSGTILSDKLPKHAPYYDAELVYHTAKQMLPCPVIDVRTCFQEYADSRQLYYYTDHHWTSQGAYLAYQYFCGSQNRDPYVYTLQEVSNHFYGTLYSKVLDPAAKADVVFAPEILNKVEIVYEDGSIADSPYQPEQLQQKDKYTYFLGGNHGILTINTKADNQKVLLLIKDSFANSFVPYLLNDYAQIVMLDLRYFTGNLADILGNYPFTDMLFLYEVSNLLTDTGILQLAPFNQTHTVVVPTPTVTPEPTVILKPIVTPEPTVILKPTVTPEPTVTPKPTAAPKPTTTPKPTATPTPTAALKPTATPKPAGNSDKLFSQNSALFIGDSRTVGLASYADLDGAHFFASIGMSVYNLDDAKVSISNIGKVSLKELLKNKKYDIIYFMLGINEIGYPFEKTVAKYKQCIDMIQDYQPNAKIILMSNIHVGAERSAKDKYVNNPALNRFNKAISTFADQKTIFYLDANPLFDDSNGNLAKDKSSDNAHLLAKYCKVWGTWIKTKTSEILTN